MPALPIEARRALLKVIGTCGTCEQPQRRDYCRQCDVFFSICACADNDETDKHATHRRYLRFPVADANHRAEFGPILHLLAEALADDKDIVPKVCPTCGKDYTHWTVENYDEIWRDGDVVCECGTRIRSYDAG